MNQLRATGVPPKPETPLVEPSSPVAEPFEVVSRTPRPYIKRKPPKFVLVPEIVPTMQYKYIQLDNHGNILNVYTGRDGLKQAGFDYQSLLYQKKRGQPYKKFYWRTSRIYEIRMVRKSVPEA